MPVDRSDSRRPVVKKPKQGAADSFKRPQTAAELLEEEIMSGETIHNSHKRHAGVDTDDDDSEVEVKPVASTRKKARMSAAEDLFNDDDDVTAANEPSSSRKRLTKAPNRLPTTVTPTAAKLTQKKPSTRKVHSYVPEAESDDEEPEADVVVDEDDFAPSPLHGRHSTAVAEDDEDEFPVDDEQLTKKSAKGKGKKTSVAKGAPKKEKEITFRDERKGVPKVADSSALKRRRSTLPTDTLTDDPPTAGSSPALVTPSKEPSPPPTKKRKLPTIKKHGSTQASDSAGPSTPVSTKPKPTGAGLGLPAPSTNPRQVGKITTDVDLTNAGVWATLFTATGTTPSAAVTKKDERRQELQRMREEDRARRAEAAKQVFDLQGQMESILRYEQMHLRHSPVLYPNILAAKIKHVWEVERSSSKDTRQWKPVNGHEVKEEGEVS